jgi:hypothetical protein
MEIPVYGQQEQSAYNGHFESTCYHPLLLFNREGDCLPAKLRPGNVHSADDWDVLLWPEIERQQKLGKEAVFRAGPRGHPAFAKLEIYEALEERGANSPFACRPMKTRSGTSRNCRPVRWDAQAKSRWSGTRVCFTRRRVKDDAAELPSVPLE